MHEYKFSDLRCHYQTGRSYVISGEGRNRVCGYRNGIQCSLGDIEQKEWCQMVTEVAHDSTSATCDGGARSGNAEAEF